MSARRVAKLVGGLFAAIAVVLAFRAVFEGGAFAELSRAPVHAGDLLARMIPPDLAFAAELPRPLWDTINVATLGTAIAACVAVPVALVAARNVSPLPWLRPVALFVVVASRSINSLIWALLLVAVVGPGVLAGTLAIALRSVGFIGKLLYEGVEEIAAEPLDAVRATGAGRAGVLSNAVAPQIAPAFAGITVFRWDVNIREATVLGLVGAGGVGLELEAAVSALDWARVATILVAILVLVVASEWLSARVRRALI